MKGALIIVGVLVVVGLIFGGQLVGSRNLLVTEKNDIDARWAQVDNDMKRRADLIPNLVETVKGYAKQEQTVIAEVANARSALLGARSKGDEINANNQLSGAIGRLLVLQENYPQLKADASFRDLQSQLEGTENRITVARQRYIAAVHDYNVTVRSFPTNLTAMMFGYQAKPSFTVENEKSISTAPTVNFGK